MKNSDLSPHLSYYTTIQIELVNLKKIPVKILKIKERKMMKRERKKFKALILAGGFGIRLKRMSENLPKGLIPCGETTIIGRIIKDLQQTPGVHKTGLISNDKFYHQYQAWLKKEGLDSKIKLINNEVKLPEKRLGAIGDLLLALDTLSWWNNHILVLPSDTLYSFRVNDLLRFFFKHQGMVTVVRKFKDKSEIANRLGCAILQGKRIVKFVEKPTNPPSFYGAIPFYVYPVNILPMIRKYQEEDQSLDTPGAIIPWLIRKEVPVYAFITDQPTLDIGKPEDLTKAKTYLQLVRLYQQSHSIQANN